MLNPQFPIRVRPAEGISPALIARYDWGATEEVSVAGMSEEQIEAALEGLVNAGASMKRSAESDVVLPQPFSAAGTRASTQVGASLIRSCIHNLTALFLS